MLDTPVPPAFARALRELGLSKASSLKGTPLTGGVSPDIWCIATDKGLVCAKRALPKLRVAVAFMEGYHIAALHRNKLAPCFRCYPVIYECFGPHALFPLPRKSIDEQRDLPESQWSVLKHASTIFSVSLHAVLNIPMDGHMELWDFQPLDVGRTRARVRFYTPEAIASDADAVRWNKSWKVSTEVISGEDFTQQQNIHINLASGPIPGVVFGQNEPMLSHFHRELGKLTGVPDAPLPESFFLGALTRSRRCPLNTQSPHASTGLGARPNKYLRVCA